MSLQYYSLATSSLLCKWLLPSHTDIWGGSCGIPKLCSLVSFQDLIHGLTEHKMRARGTRHLCPLLVYNMPFILFYGHHIHMIMQSQRMSETPWIYLAYCRRAQRTVLILQQLQKNNRGIYLRTVWQILLKSNMRHSRKGIDKTRDNLSSNMKMLNSWTVLIAVLSTNISLSKSIFELMWAAIAQV